MTFTLTAEQRAAVEGDLVAQAIVACAGSGKTATAVRRVIEIRRRMKQTKGYVALLSYSNVAVDTFRAEYEKLAKGYPGLSDRVVIATVDSFIAMNILLPHSQRSMNCAGRPFLVHGGEAWLEGCKIQFGAYPIPVRNLTVSLKDAKFIFSAANSYSVPQAIPSDVATPLVEKLARKGAYTHALGRYWALRTIVEQQRLLQILACRYPFILIDEAQDVGPMHGALVGLLEEAGVILSLIGDPNQAIFEFADADGSFLRSFDNAAASRLPLTQNRRSVPQIVAVANAVSSSSSQAFRVAPTRKHGAYFLKYKQSEPNRLVETFRAILKAHGYAENESVILCRGGALVEKIVCGAEQMGVGATERFAQAAMCRDLRGDIAQAFECAVHGVLRLMSDPPDRLHTEILGSSPSESARRIRRLIWQFLKQADAGIPNCDLPSKGEWHPRLKHRLRSLFDAIEGVSNMKRSPTWGNKFSTKDLGDGPLLKRDILADGCGAIRVRTVHKVKGEGIDAVLYVTRKNDLGRMLAGTDSEDGRIGYVALTRAKDLLIVAIPADTAPSVVSDLESKGFSTWL